MHMFFAPLSSRVCSPPFHDFLLIFPFYVSKYILPHFRFQLFLYAFLLCFSSPIFHIFLLLLIFNIFLLTFFVNIKKTQEKIKNHVWLFSQHFYYACLQLTFASICVQSRVRKSQLFGVHLLNPMRVNKHWLLCFTSKVIDQFFKIWFTCYKMQIRCL